MKTLTVTVTDEGQISIKNDDFKDYELKGLLMQVMEHLSTEQRAYDVVNMLQNSEEFKNALNTLVEDRLAICTCDEGSF